MNDTELVQGLREQNAQALRQLTECYLPSVWRFVYVQVRGDQHLAEDIVSDTVLALVRGVRGEFEIQNVAAWLRTVAVNRIRDHFRAVARVQHLLEKAPATEVNQSDPAERQATLERRREVREIMDGLPENHRLALEWKYVEHLSVKEIAGRLSTTEKAVESILFRARQEFRQAKEFRQRQAEAAVPHLNGRQAKREVQPSPISEESEPEAEAAEHR